MKYDYLINEDKNQGMSYAEYREVSKKKNAPAKKVLMARLRAERKERIKRLGKITLPNRKQSKQMFNAGFFSNYAGKV